MLHILISSSSRGHWIMTISTQPLPPTHSHYHTTHPLPHAHCHTSTAAHPQPHIHCYMPTAAHPLPHVHCHTPVNRCVVGQCVVGRCAVGQCVVGRCVVGWYAVGRCAVGRCAMDDVERVPFSLVQGYTIEDFLYRISEMLLTLHITGVLKENIDFCVVCIKRWIAIFTITRMIIMGIRF